MDSYTFRWSWSPIIGFILLAWLQSDAPAQQPHHEAHVHGIARLNVALEGNTLYLEFVSPAANIVGFEYDPRTQAERDTVASAIGILQNGEAMFELPASAALQLTEASVESGTGGDADSPDQPADNQGDHGQSEPDPRDHDHPNHDHGDHDHANHAHAAHRDFQAVYQFHCQNPEKLRHIGVKLFDLFPGIEKIRVQILTETEQTAVELTPEASTFCL